VDTVAAWNADPAFMRHMGGTLTRDETLKSFDRYADHWRRHGFGILGVEDKATGRLVGRSGVAYHRNWPLDPEVGWAVDPSWWGRGIATEAGAACVRWAFDGLALDRLVSITVEANEASRRVMDRLGFELLSRACDPLHRTELWVHAVGRP
jgi:RimJ/RimL family protein N-acetyltransferase